MPLTSVPAKTQLVFAGTKLILNFSPTRTCDTLYPTSSDNARFNTADPSSTNDVIRRLQPVPQVRVTVVDLKVMALHDDTRGKGKSGVATIRLLAEVARESSLN